MRQGAVLKLRYRVEQAPEQSVMVGLRCTELRCGTRAGAMLDVTRVFKNSKAEEWRTLSIPLPCCSAAGADLAGVKVPFVLETSGRFGLTISEVALAAKALGAAPSCP